MSQISFNSNQIEQNLVNLKKAEDILNSTNKIEILNYQNVGNNNYLNAINTQINKINSYCQNINALLKTAENALISTTENISETDQKLSKEVKNISKK